MIASETALARSSNKPFEDPSDRPSTDGESQGGEPGAVPYDGGAMPDSEPAIERIKRKHEARLLGLEGVTGVGVGSDEIGDAVILVYVLDASISKNIPSDLDGINVQTQVTGEIDALPGATE